MAKKAIEWRDRVVEVRRVRADQIVNAPWNYRTHPESQRRAVEGSIRELGFFDPLDVFETRDGQLMLIDGQARSELISAQVGPDTMIPVNVTDLDESEARAALLLKDRTAAMAATDDQMLAELVESIEVEDLALQDLVDDIAADLEPKDGKGSSKGEQQPELVISPELYERHDYLVIVFDNEFDWQVACERLGVQTVQMDPNETSTIRQRGVGRVIRGDDFIRHLSQ